MPTENLPSPSRLRIIVAQLGARRRYAVPRMLHQKGLLECLYTDFCLPEDRVPAVVAAMLQNKLRRRMIKGIPSSRIRSSLMLTLDHKFPRSLSVVERYLRVDRTAGRAMSRWGVGKANIVYGMYGSGTPFWHDARRQGLCVAGDMFITPMWHAIVRGEQDAFPDWEMPEQDARLEEAFYDQLSQQTIEAADVLICPSETVCDGLHTFAAEPRRKGLRVPRTIVVPYGIDSRNMGRTEQSVPGRILFAGGADLRKGIHYFALATSLLKARGGSYEFRVAGKVTDRVRHHPAARHLTFLGHLSREDLDQEYRLADLVALPTLAEGSPAVVHEALAFGLPVVTTRSAGSVLTDGREGLLVPERDVEALAAALSRIVEDRALREAMSHAAVTTAGNFDEGPWADRLVAALEAMHA